MKQRNESACCGNCPWPAYYPDAECHLCRRGDWCEILLDHPACPAHPDFWQEETPVAVETLAEACARGDVSGQIRDVKEGQDHVPQSPLIIHARELLLAAWKVWDIAKETPEELVALRVAIGKCEGEIE